MSFSRSTPPLLQSGALDASLRGIGMRLGSRGQAPVAADLEVTLVSGTQRSLPSDYRALGVLVAWLEVHQARVNVPRLLRLVRDASKTPLERAWWASIGSWLGQEDVRWKRMTRVYDGPALDLDDRSDLGD